MISEKLMMALLSLDAYSRSSPELAEDVTLYRQGGIGFQVGSATVIDVVNIPGSSFVAVNYSWNGKTVLAFRGTDNLSVNPLTGEFFGSDIWNGWTIGAGWNEASQAQLAQDFYLSQTGSLSWFDKSPDVILTGHSLGGGLAGYLSALNGTKAYGFDHMTFGPAAEATIVAYLNSMGITDPTEQQYAALGLKLQDASQFIGTHVAGEILEGVRNGNYAQFGAMFEPAAARILTALGMGDAWLLENMSAAQAAYEDNVQNSTLTTMGWGSGDVVPSIARHSQGLLVLLQYGVDEATGGQWASSGFMAPLISSLYKDNVAESIGIYKGPVTDLAASGRSNPADLMLTKIAYTVLDSGNLPFGDSAIRSLFNDADAVGAFLNDGGNSRLDVAGIADDIARFAGLQAHHGVIGQHDGFVSIDGNLLALDYRQQTWTFGDHVAAILGEPNDFSGYLTDKALSSTEIIGLDQWPTRFEYEFYSSAVGGWQGQIGFESTLYTVKAVGTDTWDTIIGTDGDEAIYLGGGNDQVKANGGVNWIDGGAGDDTLIDDNAWADFEITLDFGRYYFALRNSGADPRIHVLENMELFRLGGKDFDATNILNVAPTDVFISSFVGDTGSDGFLPGSVAAGAEIANLCVVDGNEHDRFTWEILGNGANFYTIENGVLKASVAFTYSYLYWYAAVGAVTYTEWQANDLTPGFANLLGTQYGITVRATDAAGQSTEKDVFLFLENIYSTLVGTPQNDTLVGGPGQTFVAGLGGADTISDNDWLVLDYSASDAGVTITKHASLGGRMLGTGGHAQGDIINLGRDTRFDIIGSAYDDVLNGTSPESLTWGWMRTGDNAIFGGGGNDIINGGSGSNWLHGGDGNDTITGGGGYDEIYGGDGYDIINAGGGTNYVDFGTGGGELKLPVNYQPYYANLETREFRYLNGQAGTTTTVVGDFDRLTGTNYNDELHGSSLADIIYGGGGPNDKIWGYGGNDHLEGAGSIYGGDGDDTIALIGTGTAWGGGDKDTITANTSGSTIYGGEGMDTLTALSTGVTIVGGGDADTITFYTYNGMASSTLSYFDSPDGITVRTVGNKVHGYGGDAEGDVVTGSFKLVGTDHVDDIRLAGFSNMEVRSGGGSDYISIGMKTSITIYAGSGEDEIHLNRGQTAYGEDDDDAFYGVGTMYGGDGNDEFYLELDYYTQFTNKFWSGGVVNGGIGSNTIHGGGGDDRITMSLGSDTFIFRTGGRKDTVIGAGSDDVIRLDGVLAFSTMSDVVGSLQQAGSNVMLDFGKMSDHKDIYGDNAPDDYIGSIQFNGMTIAQVSALSWEFV